MTRVRTRRESGGALGMTAELDPDRWRICIHEASHAVVSLALGRGVRLVSVRPTATYRGIVCLGRNRPRGVDGFSPDRPPALQPAGIRRLIETRVMVDLAGDLAGRMVAPGSGPVYRGDDEADLVTSRAIAALSPTETVLLASLEGSGEHPTDWESAARAAQAWEPTTATQFLAWLHAETVRLIALHARAIWAVAEALNRDTVLSGRQVREIVHATEGKGAT